MTQKQDSGLVIISYDMNKSSARTENSPDFCRSLVVKPCFAFRSQWGSQEASPEPSLLPQNRIFELKAQVSL